METQTQTQTQRHNGGEKQPDSAAARAAIERTNSWQPSRSRRQSWSKEDQKHSLQMSGVRGIRSGHDGFTERG
ncbi:hypothetical protein ESCO_005326 [Escovopsis weberi]|uniref:Uncharacterized protein n=1 Tax=Escovopsis weberi TaxID=150374 RepID=A0A0M8N083_ESCWE|nr:hypothetical protein ESCO_005326 [Escovopsis weberi]